MRLFPRLVLLVACVPLLLPPGLCACGSEAVAPSRRVNVANVAPAAAPVKRCGCGHTAKHATTETRTVVPSAPEHEHQVPHVPSCPAVTGVERAPWAERAEPVDHVTALAFVVACANPFAFAEPGTHDAPTPHCAPAFEDRPRYLTHCALLF